jgi:hypothetical protein
MPVLYPVNSPVKVAVSLFLPYWEQVMDGVQNISVVPVLQDADCGQDISQNTQLVPSRDPALAGAIAKRPAIPSRPLRMLLADCIDRQFPLIRSA